MGAFPMQHVVPRLLGTPGSIRARAPKLGEHNRELLGLGDDAYAELARAGVFAEGEAKPGEEE
jgi:formyl-CoA transferase